MDISMQQTTTISKAGFALIGDGRVHAYSTEPGFAPDGLEWVDLDTLASVWQDADGWWMALQGIQSLYAIDNVLAAEVLTRGLVWWDADTRTWWAKAYRPCECYMCRADYDACVWS